MQKGRKSVFLQREITFNPVAACVCVL